MMKRSLNSEVNGPATTYCTCIDCNYNTSLYLPHISTRLLALMFYPESTMDSSDIDDVE